MFVHQRQVYADDTDYSGVVYHANYLKFMEHARSEWLHSLGLSLKQLAQEGYLIIIRSAHVEYLKAACLNDPLAISCQITESSRTQVVFHQEVRSAQNKDCIYAIGTIKLVCVNQQLKPVRIPEVLVNKIMEIKKDV